MAPADPGLAILMADLTGLDHPPRLREPEGRPEPTVRSAGPLEAIVPLIG